MGWQKKYQSDLEEITGFRNPAFNEIMEVIKMEAPWAITANSISKKKALTS